MNFPRYRNILIQLTYLIGWVAIIFFYFKNKNKSIFYLIFTASLLLGVIIIQSINILYDDVIIPQAILSNRFFSGFFILSLYIFFVPISIKLTKKWSAVLIKRLVFCSLLGYLSIATFSRYQLSKAPDEMGMRDLHEQMENIKLHLKSGDIIISDSQEFNIYAPIIMHVRTLYSNPFTTLASNRELINEYHLANYLLGNSTEDFFKKFVINYDESGEPHFYINNFISSSGEVFNIIGQGLINVGPAHSYPIPASWISDNRSNILELLS
jgi:hypothetical protein